MSAFPDPNKTLARLIAFRRGGGHLVRLERDGKAPLKGYGGWQRNNPSEDDIAKHLKIAGPAFGAHPLAMGCWVIDIDAGLKGVITRLLRALKIECWIGPTRKDKRWHIWIKAPKRPKSAGFPPTDVSWQHGGASGEIRHRGQVRITKYLRRLDSLTTWLRTARAADDRQLDALMETLTEKTQRILPRPHQRTAKFRYPDSVHTELRRKIYVRCLKDDWPNDTTGIAHYGVCNDLYTAKEAREDMQEAANAARATISRSEVAVELWTTATGSVKKLLIAMASFCHGDLDNGVCYARQTSLAEATGWTGQYIGKLQKQAEAEGHIVRSHKVKNWRGKPTQAWTFKTHPRLRRQFRDPWDLYNPELEDPWRAPLPRPPAKTASFKMGQFDNYLRLSFTSADHPRKGATPASSSRLAQCVSTTVGTISLAQKAPMAGYSHILPKLRIKGLTPRDPGFPPRPLARPRSQKQARSIASVIVRQVGERGKKRLTIVFATGVEESSVQRCGVKGRPRIPLQDTVRANDRGRLLHDHIEQSPAQEELKRRQGMPFIRDDVPILLAGEPLERGQGHLRGFHFWPGHFSPNFFSPIALRLLSIANILSIAGLCLRPPAPLRRLYAMRWRIGRTPATLTTSRAETPVGCPALTTGGTPCDTPTTTSSPTPPPTEKPSCRSTASRQSSCATSTTSLKPSASLCLSERYRWRTARGRCDTSSSSMPLFACLPSRTARTRSRPDTDARQRTRHATPTALATHAAVA